MTSTSDWLHFHQSNASAAGQTPYATSTTSDLFFSDRASDSTVVSTTMSPITNPPPTGPAQLGPNPSRVTKPARKRTRASRRTPTTLLNTDTTNFRAMVQQFTGGPSSNFDIPGPSPQIFVNGMGRGYGVHQQMGQLQQQGLSPLQYSISSNNNNNNINMLMQSMGENNYPTTRDHDTNNNNNMNMRLNGGTAGGGSSSSENRSMDSFHY
ncbi:hypothetical protein SOVF_099930 [Spinacia oleracea]|nr:hypothetical protein SOVF_099930 [Spinacia oleracea]